MRSIKQPTSTIEQYLHLKPNGLYQLRYYFPTPLRKIDPNLPTYIVKPINTTDNDSLLDSDGDDLRGVDFLQDLDQQQFTQEFQLGASSEKFDLITGVYYLHEKANWDGLVFAAFGLPANMPPIPSGTNPPANFIFEFRSANETNAWAIFWQTDYKMTQKIIFTAGVRYSHEEKKNTVSTPDSLGGFFGLVEPRINKKSWEAITPKFGVEYFANDDLMFFASASRGFKSGGFNSTATREDQLTPFDPEFIWSYEGGFKGVFIEKSMQVNGSVFFYDYEDMQVFTFNSESSASIENAANAKGYGAEVELTIIPNERLKILFAAAFLEATFDKYIADGTQIGFAGVPVDLSGNTIRNSPKWSFNVAFNYKLPLAEGASLKFHVDGNYKSEVFFDQFNQSILSQDDLLLVNGKVAYTIADGRWEVALFGINLTGEEYLIGAVGLPAQNNAPQGYVGEPRQYGIQMSYHY